LLLVAVTEVQGDVTEQRGAIAAGPGILQALQGHAAPPTAILVGGRAK